MGRYGNLDCPTLTGRGFPLGLSMLLVGTAGEAFLPALVGPLPPREDALLLDLEMLGLVVAFLSPGLFGFPLPRTEGGGGATSTPLFPLAPFGVDRLPLDVDGDRRPEPHVRVPPVEHHEVTVGERERSVAIALYRQVSTLSGPLVYPCHAFPRSERDLTLAVKV